MGTALGWAVLGVVITGFIGVVAMMRSDIGRIARHLCQHSNAARRAFIKPQPVNTRGLTSVTQRHLD